MSQTTCLVLEKQDFLSIAKVFPELYDYVEITFDASLSISHMQATVCFLGHPDVIPVTLLGGQHVHAGADVYGEYVPARHRECRKCWAAARP